MKILIIVLINLFWIKTMEAQQRFPRPDFDRDYTPPEASLPLPRQQWLEYLDVFVLTAALVLVGYLLFRRRSRPGVLLVSIFSIVYFGFWRRGCVCAVGSVQNAALGFGDAEYMIPVTVIAFFALPLLFALFSGRTFCAAVCPLGVIQDLVIWRPIKVRVWLNYVLGLIPWIYLGTAVLFAATGTGFLICQWDPFINIFWLGGSLPMLGFGGLVLAVGMFVARPYCRFLCPYSVLLGMMSRFSWKHLSITPDKCIQCRLCENACPFDAIRKPQSETPPEPRRQGIRRLALILVLTPFVVMSAAGAGYLFGNVLSKSNHEVALALEIYQQDEVARQDMSLESEAFFTSGLPAEELYAEARAVQEKFAFGGGVLGALLALIVCLKILGLSIWRSQTDYEPDRTQCLSCGRCFDYCPVKPGKETLSEPL